MFEGWHEFYLVVGGAAAVLIGLIFVVVTLMHGRPRSTVLTGSRLYMGPIVLHMGFVLTLSAAALTPRMTFPFYAALVGVISVWGTARGLYSTIRIGRLKAIGGEEVHWTDVWFYGVIPMVVYLALAGVALGAWRGADWSLHGAAAAQVALLLVSIRNEYDLVTWLAPRSDGDATPESS
ncbi:hypothetical protein [Sphingomonas flavescens]|uniref:hypothetical protein n=1 Tax=Sphingomonas flavescens TaxID=3132797 RepID=UPI002805C6CF|nr:hypothetical protein [Sphingomonas limnosediminicola]